MSHVETVNTQILDLASLKKACERLGVEFIEGRKTYKWFGRSVGDYPLPAGYTAADLGKCDHVIKVPGVEYEIGVVQKKNGKGYDLLFDFWGPGQGLLQKFSKGLTKLVDAYSVETLKAKARAKGYLCSEQQLPNGKTKLTVTGFTGN